MTIQNDTLIIINSKKRIQKIYLSLNKDEDREIYYIERYSGQYGGKETAQPIHTIEKGKVKRTVLEQATLEYNSILKKYLDKGYNKLSSLTNKAYSELSEEELKSLLGGTTTDQSGIPKPMLAKIAGDCKADIWNRQWWASRKIDGVRALFYYKDGEIKTSSRGGQDYDVATTYIKQDPFLLEVFAKFPNIILDGEIYRHGWNLSTISGLCRLDSVEDRHKELCFHCYDIVNEEATFNNRFAVLQSLYQLREENYPESKLVIVEHFIVRSNQEIMAAHNKFIAEGYEGAVIRDPNEVYKCGGRDRRMQKIKLFTDAEFKILGLSEGLREEDMCFIMETADGNQFKAKPIGSREDKQWYRDHIKELIGKMGTVKFFGMTNTEHPVPNLPVFKSVRLEKDA